MAQRLRFLAVIMEDLASILSTYFVTHNHLVTPAPESSITLLWPPKAQLRQYTNTHASEDPYT